MEDDVKAKFAALHESIKSLYRMDGQQAEQIKSLEDRFSKLEEAYHTIVGFIKFCKYAGYTIAWAAGILSGVYTIYHYLWK